MTKREQKMCARCGLYFVPYSERQKYCSPKCAKTVLYAEHQKLMHECLVERRQRDKDRLARNAHLAQRDLLYKGEFGKQDGEVRGRVPCGCAGAKHIWTSKWQ